MYSVYSKHIDGSRLWQVHGRYLVYYGTTWLVVKLWWNIVSGTWLMTVLCGWYLVYDRISFPVLQLQASKPVWWYKRPWIRNMDGTQLWQSIMGCRWAINNQSWMIPGTWAMTANCWWCYSHEGYMGRTMAMNGLHSWYCDPKEVPRWYIGYGRLHPPILLSREVYGWLQNLRRVVHGLSTGKWD